MQWGVAALKLQRAWWDVSWSSSKHAVHNLFSFTSPSECSSIKDPLKWRRKAILSVDFVPQWCQGGNPRWAPAVGTIRCSMLISPWSSMLQMPALITSCKSQQVTKDSPNFRHGKCPFLSNLPFFPMLLASWPQGSSAESTTYPSPWLWLKPRKLHTWSHFSLWLGEN